MAYSKSILRWRELTIQVRYDDDWLNGKSRGHQVAHLELETIEPKRAANPIAETGYRSYFTSKEEIESYGGTVTLVKTWLDLEAKSDKWQQYELDQKQMSLF